jgi:hypothetical protein
MTSRKSLKLTLLSALNARTTLPFKLPGTGTPLAAQSEYIYCLRSGRISISEPSRTRAAASGIIGGERTTASPAGQFAAHERRFPVLLRQFPILRKKFPV